MPGSDFSIPQLGAPTAPSQSSENQSIIDLLKGGSSSTPSNPFMGSKLPPGLDVQSRMQDASSPADHYAKLRSMGMSHEQAVGTMSNGGMYGNLSKDYLNQNAPLY